MKKLFIPNFDFEYQLGERTRRHIPAAAARLNRELASVWVSIAATGDFIWTDANVEQGFFDRMSEAGLPEVTAVHHPSAVTEPVEACPWGWTTDLRKQASSRAWRIDAPEQPAVDRANARSFSFDLEQQWNVGLEGARAVASLDEFLHAVDELPDGNDGWVLKSQYAMSARERILGKRDTLPDAARNWLGKKLADDGIAFFEPWVERIEEAGLQYMVPVAGEPVFVGLAPLLTDAAGHYRGNRFTSDPAAEARWAPAIETGNRIARAVQALGYFGPLGIDAARYRAADGVERLRPIQDINARYTMGRIALGFQKLLKPGEQGSWLHFIWPDDDPIAPAQWWERTAQLLPAEVRAIRTTPFTVAGHATRHGTVVLIAGTPAQLERAEHVFRQAQ